MNGSAATMQKILSNTVQTNMHDQSLGNEEPRMVYPANMKTNSDIADVYLLEDLRK